MRPSFFAASALSTIVLVAGCTTIPYAREVKKKPSSGGLIALRTSFRPEDRTKADELMKLNCGDRAVTVDEEGEAVVGQKTNSTASKSQGTTTTDAFSLGGLNFGNTKPSENTSGSSETTSVKEWQITYTCGTKEMASPAAPPSSAPTARK